MRARPTLSSFSVEVSPTIIRGLIFALHNIVEESVLSEKRMQPLIAKALRTDLNRSVELSMKAMSSHIHVKR